MGKCLVVLHAMLFSTHTVMIWALEDIPREIRVGALTATVRIRNGASQKEGSGALVARSEAYIYVLTARHVVTGANRLEVAVFTTRSYPEPDSIYRNAEMVAESSTLVD